MKIEDDKRGTFSFFTDLSCGKEARSTLFRQVDEDLVEGGFEAHRKEAIGLVQNQHFQRLDVQR